MRLAASCASSASPADPGNPWSASIRVASSASSSSRTTGNASARSRACMGHDNDRAMALPFGHAKCSDGVKGGATLRRLDPVRRHVPVACVC